MCFKPKDVPSKKVALVQLERAKVSLEDENSALKLKLRDLQATHAHTLKERDSLSLQRAELESQLQHRASHASHLLTQVTYLRTDLTLRLRELLDQAGVNKGKAPAKSAFHRTVNVHVLQPECMNGIELNIAGEACPEIIEETAFNTELFPTQIGPRLLPQAQQLIMDDETVGSLDVQLSVQQQLDRELEAIAQVHWSAVEQVNQLCAQLRQAEGDNAQLQESIASARRRLEHADANAADQQQVLQLRYAALEQENEQLTSMNEEMQQRLEGAQSELASAQKQWSTDGAQLAKQAAELKAAGGRLREAEAELRALHSQLATAMAEAQEANFRFSELQEQVEGAKASEKFATEALNDVRSQLAGTQRELAAAQRELAAAQRELAAAQQQLAMKTQAVLDSNAQLAESRAALEATGERLSHALEEVAAGRSRVSEANEQYLRTKQSVITTSKQLGSMAKDHAANLTKLHALEAEITVLHEQFATMRAAEVALRAQADSNSAAAREAREASEIAGAEARRLRVAYDTASSDLRRKIMLLTAIARMADKGQAAGASGARARDGQAADPADGYRAVTSEQRLRLKICDSPLPLLGALTAGIMDSSRLRHLSLDMDTSREVTWEKAGLRICCLAAAIGLNNSLQTLQLAGWTWGELGNGTALPFLALGGGGGGVAGGMLRSVQLATNVFDLEAAAMLKDLLAAGLVDLAVAGPAAAELEESVGGQRSSGGGSGAVGQGTLYLYSGNERLDGWYREMLLLADRRPHGSRGSNSSGGTGGTATAAAGPTLRTVGYSIPGASCNTAPHLTNSLSVASFGHLMPASDGARHSNSGSILTAATAASALSMSFSSSSSQPTRASAPLGEASASAAAMATAAVDCDLSCEALESHHMVLVMTVLLTCSGMKRLRLDGNKLGDGGAGLLALGLATNTSLRELYLSRNGIHAAGTRSLARCLEGANSTLLRLDLSGQRLEGIGAAGAEALAQALRTNRALEDLDLSSCGLTGATSVCFAGAIRVAGAMRQQATAVAAVPCGTGGCASPRSSGGGGCLRRLVLTGNGIDATTSKALQAAAAERPGLVLAL